MGVLAGSVIKGGHSPLNGPVTIYGTDKIRPATALDFDMFRVVLPPDFKEVSVNKAETKTHQVNLDDILKEAGKVRIGVRSTKTLHEDNYAPMISDVDPNFYEDPEVVKIVEFCLKERKNLLIVGPPGVGKSSLLLNVAGRFRMAVEYYGCNGESNTDQLIGVPSATLIDGVKVPVPVFGAAVLAFKYGAMLTLDEVDFMTPEVASCLHQMGELSTKRITIYLNGKHIIERHPEFFMVATANTAGHGEDGFVYHGTQAQNAAFLNRFTYTAKMSYLLPDKEVELIEKKSKVNSKIANAMVLAATDSRTKVAKEEIVHAISPRDLFAWGDLMTKAKLDWTEAAKFAFINRMSKSDEAAVETLVRARKPV